MKIKILQYGHGYNGGGILDGEVCPSITTSSWHHNNFIIEYGTPIDGNVEPKILLEMEGKDIIPYNTPEDGVAPTITTMYARLGTNNLTPGEYGGVMGIMEISKDKMEEKQYKAKRIQALVDSGKIDPERVQFLDCYNQSVSDDVTGTISTRIDGANHYFVTEPKSCASRKRREEHKIETRQDEVANCVTSIDTDSMVQEPIIITDPYATFGEIRENKDVSPTLRARDSKSPHLVAEPQVLTPLRTEEGRQLRKQGIEKFSNRALYPREDGCSNTITTLLKDNYLQEPKIVGYSRDEKGKIVGHHLKDVANTITGSSTQGNSTSQYVAEGTEYKGKFIKEGDGLYTNVSKDFIRGGLDGVSRTLKAEKHDAATCIKAGARYRIRKLTEREVFRLMDVSEEDIDKIQAAGISKTAMYKLAGNSIVVSCLYWIFYKMFINRECEDIQGSLF